MMDVCNNSIYLAMRRLAMLHERLEHCSANAVKIFGDLRRLWIAVQVGVIRFGEQPAQQPNSAAQLEPGHANFRALRRLRAGEVRPSWPSGVALIKL